MVIGQPIMPPEKVNGKVPRRVVKELTEQLFVELGDLYIEKVLEQTGGNKVQAAKRLGINRRTLYRRGDRKRDRDSSDPDREHDSED